MYIGHQHRSPSTVGLDTSTATSVRTQGNGWSNQSQNQTHTFIFTEPPLSHVLFCVIQALTQQGLKTFSSQFKFFCLSAGFSMFFPLLLRYVGALLLQEERYCEIWWDSPPKIINSLVLCARMGCSSRQGQRISWVFRQHKQHFLWSVHLQRSSDVIYSKKEGDTLSGKSVGIGQRDMVSN